MKIEKIEIRVTEKDKKEIKENAEKLGLTVSAYMIMLHKINQLGGHGGVPH